MAVTVSHDVDYNTHPTGPNREVLDLIAKNGGTLVHYQHRGPGGHNPNYGVEFPTLDAAAAYLEEVYEGTLADTGGVQTYVVPNGAFDYKYDRRRLDEPASIADVSE